MEHDAADDLHPVGFHLQHAPGSFPAGGEGFGQKIVQAFALLIPVFELLGFAFQLLIAEGGVFLLQCFHRLDFGLDLFQLSGAGVAKELFEKCICHWVSPTNFSDNMIFG